MAVASGGETEAREGRSAEWRKILLGGTPSGGTTNDAREQPFSKWQGELTEANQRVIKADVDRTRSDNPFFKQAEVRLKMEAMLTCWCQQQGVKYKQGLNEVIAPFLCLQKEPEGSAPSDDEIFACFTAFLRRFAPLFESEDFVPLQCTFVFFQRLLLYHYPDLHHFLREQGVSPEMFCMPWFLTVFASKTPLNVILLLWDRVLNRNEPSFFVFIAVAVVANAQQAVFPAEGGALPEILTSLGLGSCEELERHWTAAEGLFSTTPATFAARLRRTVLGKKGQARSSVARESAPGNSAVGDGEEERVEQEKEKFLERLEQEKCFFILPEELVGHCYPPRSGEVRQPWHPSPENTWRLIILDLRPHQEFEAARLPTALSFDLSALPASSSSGTAHPTRLGKIFHWKSDSGDLEPARVFDALKATLGEDWVCDREAHICLLGSQEPEKAAIVRKLYQVLTLDLSLRHVSVASGGFEKAVECARKYGHEIITDSPVSNGTGVADVQTPPADDPPRNMTSTASESRWGFNAAKLSAAANATSTAALSAWSGLKKAATSKIKEDPKRAQGEEETSADVAPNAKSEAKTSCSDVDAASTSTPVLRRLPGNWPDCVDLASLPRQQLSDLTNEFHWPCIAIALRHDADATTRKRSVDLNGAWEGCNCLLSMCRFRLICSLEPSEDDSSGSVVVLVDYQLSRVQRVTSKKQAPEVVLFYFKEMKTAGGGNAPSEDKSDKTAASMEKDPSLTDKMERARAGTDDGSDAEMILYFRDGVDAVKSFIKALRLGQRKNSLAAAQLAAAQLAANNFDNGNEGRNASESFEPPARQDCTKDESPKDVASS